MEIFMGTRSTRQLFCYSKVFEGDSPTISQTTEKVSSYNIYGEDNSPLRCKKVGVCFRRVCVCV